MKSTSAWRTWLGILLLLGSLCAMGGPMRNERVFQAFEFGNYGQGSVTGVEIAYGPITIPRGTAHRDYEPVHRVLTRETEVISVPESAAIRWTSADGQHHEVTAPMRSFIQDASCFHGFRFQFVDDHVDVYLISRVGDCAKLLNTKLTKVFPP